MAIIKQVYKGDVVLSSSSTTTNVILSDAVDTTKSILLFSVRTSAANWQIPQSVIAGYLVDSTTITFGRAIVSSSVEIVVSWQVIEFFSGVNVQRGVTNMSSNTNVTISTVDLTKSFVICTLASEGWSSYTDYNYEECVRARLTSSTNLNLSIQTSQYSQTVTWQVIEYDNCNVQQIDYTIPTSATISDLTISTIDPERTFVCGTFSTRERVLSGRDMINFYILNDTQIRFRRINSVASNQLWTIFVVQFDLGEVIVKNLSTNISSGSTATVVSIDEVNTEMSFISINSIYNTFGSIDVNDDLLTVNTFTYKFNSVTEIQFERTNSGYSGIIYYQIVEFILPYKQWHLRGLNRGLFMGMM